VRAAGVAAEAGAEIRTGMNAAGRACEEMVAVLEHAGEAHEECTAESRLVGVLSRGVVGSRGVG
jgi:hypothetical protein